uniref:Lactoylglutathione lyase n=1 Tax=Paulinella chromatophora TaxID=39717 RepID=B1X4D3_PAUCH|nr:lactoylglutathione lyase [Paulinella chromatophora]ACB42802.1 lactoylglutathione lyase [Paulinella chromatophora]
MQLPHTILMVSNLDYQSGRFTLVPLGLGQTFLVRIRLQLRKESRMVESCYVQITLGLNNIQETYMVAMSMDSNWIRKLPIIKHADRAIAFFEDPDGYNLELIKFSHSTNFS